jgi:hypothetical protein
MNYINTETGEYPLTDAQVRARFENVTFAAHDFPPAPYVEVQPTAQPAFNPSAQAVSEAAPVLADGVWTQAWAVTALPSDVAAAKLAEHQEFMWDAIKARRDFLSDTGGYLAGGKWFHSDAKSKTQQLALAMMGAAVPAVQWKTMDGSFIAMSQTLAGQIFQAAAQQDMSIFAVAESHRAAMLASSNPMAYKFDGGWPAVFPA